LRDRTTGKLSKPGHAGASRSSRDLKEQRTPNPKLGIQIARQR